MMLKWTMLAGPTQGYLLIFWSLAVRAQDTCDYAANQLENFKLRTQGPIGIINTAAGRPVELDEFSSLDKNLLENEFWIDSQAHVVRERIPNRIVHPKGIGAFGYFEVTHDVSKYTKALFLKDIGKKTSVAARLSPTATESGAPDTIPDIGGISIKFYTEEGNLDLLTFSIPIFFFSDPIQFFLALHTTKRNPATNLLDPNPNWDYATLTGEVINFKLYTLSKFATPDGYRFINAFPVHTYELENEEGEIHFVRFNFINDAGLKFLTLEQANALAVQDPDYYARDMYNAIANGTYPSWTLNIQVMTPAQMRNASFDPLSVLIDWPTDQYPLEPVGRLVLNRNPKNYFTEVEQIAFCPGNLVPGILGAPDRIFQARKFSYRDAQFHRLGPNFKQLPINKPKIVETNYLRDGQMQLNNQGDAPNYYPNSFNGPVPLVTKKTSKDSLIGKLIYREDPVVDIYAHSKDLYANRLDEDDKCNLALNVARSLSKTYPFIQDRAVKIMYKINNRLGQDVSDGLAGTLTCN